MITAVDSTVILDSLTLDPEFEESSRKALSQAYNAGSVILSEIVYAEIAGQFPTPDALDRYLSDTRLNLVPAGADALHQAGRAWMRYVRTRPAGIVCASCGRRNRPSCEGCRSALRGRQHLVADFLIGAHAAAHADGLLSRDRGYYATYFPKLHVIDPSV